MKTTTILLAVLSAGCVVFGAPIEADGTGDVLDNIVVIDDDATWNAISLDKRVSPARTAAYTAYTGTSNNGRGCTGDIRGETQDVIGDNGNPDTCRNTPGAGCVVLTDFVRGPGTCFVRLFNQPDCQGPSQRFDGQRVVDSMTFNYVSFEAQCLGN